MLVDNLTSPLNYSLLLSFAQEGGIKKWQVALSSLDKRVSEHEYLADTIGTIDVELIGGVDREGRSYLDLSIKADWHLLCQRCLNPMNHTLEDKSHIILLDNEADADEYMNDESEILVVSDSVTVQQLLEDQILMAMPFSPKHQHCGDADLTQYQDKKDNPFAVLAKKQSN